MKLRCPVCHSSNSLEAFTADAEGRELLVLLAASGPLFGPVVGYLGCFRPAKRDLDHGRALRLAREVLDLSVDRRTLATALAETVEALRRKRDQGQIKPLKDHKYLLAVLESVSTTPPSPLLNQEGGAERRGAVGKRRQAIELLAAWAGSDWLRVEIAQGLQALVALPHLTPPGTDAIELTAGVFETVIRRRVNIAEVDAGRVTAAFAELLKASLKEWPEPAAVIGQLPPRPDRRKLAEPGPTEEGRAAGIAAAARIRENL